MRNWYEFFIAILFFALVPYFAFSNTAPIPHRTMIYKLFTGEHENLQEERVLAFKQRISVPDAVWLRVHFNNYNLGKKSFVAITSVADGSVQWLDADAMERWRSYSAVLNGGEIEVELHVAPGDQRVHFEISELVVGTSPVQESIQEGGEPQSLCGADDRIASADPRVGRVSPIGCTAWFGPNGALLTAGHCVDNNHNGVVDGNFVNGVIEFNVPSSTESGQIVPAALYDQYPINANRIAFHYDGDGKLGKDWSVFATLPNDYCSETRDRPCNEDEDCPSGERCAVTSAIQAQAAFSLKFCSGTMTVPCNSSSDCPGEACQELSVFYRVTQEIPSTGTTADQIRITGFGTDQTPPGSTGGRNSDTQTDQTSEGPYLGQSSSGSNFWHEYQTDTEGGNSGGPTIWGTSNVHGHEPAWSPNFFTIGIHTNAGCSTTSGNTGTSFNHLDLANTLDDFPATNTIYVDNRQLDPQGEDGTVFRPYDRVEEGIDHTPSGGRVHIAPGTYTLTQDITEEVAIVCSVGLATLSCSSSNFGFSTEDPLNIFENIMGK